MKQTSGELDRRQQKSAKPGKPEAEKRRMEELLRESEERLRTQYRYIPVPTITWQRKGNDFVITDYNIAAEEFTDGLIANFVGMKAGLIYRDRPDILNDMVQCFDGKGIVKRETSYRMFTKGVEKIIAFTFAYVPPDLVLSHMEDVTPRKMAEEELLKSERELRALSARLIEVQEKERKRFARELHDSIGQYLTTIKFNAENTLGQIQRSCGENSPAVASLQAGIPLIQQTIEEVRRIMMDLRPSILDDLGILATISWFCREFQTVYSHIQIEKDISIEETGVADPLKIVIFRILQESLNNVAKHSSADHVRIGLKKARRRLYFSISDNGTGFEVKHAFNKDTPGGLGLIGMRERVELSGGRLRIESRPGKGTTIRASWPSATG